MHRLFRKHGGGPLSSAILYLGIVVIWACVLIPRWLRRDSARDTADSYDDSGYRSDEWESAGTSGTSGTAAELDADAAPAADPAPEHAIRDERRRRVLAARRRMLWMLSVLMVTALALATMGLAAWWVVVPPTVMLLGYLVLLREAAQADAERALAVEAADRARARSEAAARDAAARGAAAREAAAYRATPPPAPDAEVIDISAQVGAQEFYDQYTDARLRAVGD